MSSNNFELHAKADEWMEVTPREDILQAELDRLKLAFEKCSSQLDACRLENDLVKGHKTNLETETQHLKEALQLSQEEVEKKTQEWKDLNAWTDERMRSYQQTIREQAMKNSELEDQKLALTEACQQETKRLADSESRWTISMNKLEAEKQSLQRKVAELQQDNKQQHETIARFYKDLESTRSHQERLQRELAQAKDTIAKQQQEMQTSKKDTGTIAILAQELKSQKQVLERSLNLTKQSLASAQMQEGDRAKQLMELREQYEHLQSTRMDHIQELETMVENQIHQLNESQNAIQQLQVQLSAATQEVQTLKQDNHELSIHLTHMEAGRHEWLEQKSELQESLDETFHDLEAANERLHQLEETLEATELQRASLAAHQSNFSEAADREAALLMQLQEQRMAFEERLKEIRCILGLKFTAAIQSEVQHKFRNVEMPMSFQVPLLAQKIV